MNFTPTKNIISQNSNKSSIIKHFSLNLQKIAMLAFQVNSIPLKDVIISLAHSFEVPYFHSCDEYYLTLPKNLGSGEIRGVNFDNGLALLI